MYYFRKNKSKNSQKHFLCMTCKLYIEPSLVRLIEFFYMILENYVYIHTKKQYFLQWHFGFLMKKGLLINNLCVENSYLCTAYTPSAIYFNLHSRFRMTRKKKICKTLFQICFNFFFDHVFRGHQNWYCKSYGSYGPFWLNDVIMVVSENVLVIIA